ncbi:CBS domain-containing protein [Merismopedia glauca]|uniref:Phosphoribulokinase n=1 Tax=Merismopedia glauca CCAP 1448/3 TaxID=1296344 RepID=A0A2T1C9A3_9CYAN|nr:CBS domain-containing protein [Merismopedia glauca]PSB04727.1 phosphoribulokinase [Merismopedia glauca CCAP 1448/3]
MPKTVAEIMTGDVISVKSQTPIQEAIRILAERRIGGLPVIDDNGNLVGILSETDLMWQATGVNPPAHIVLLDSVIYLENPGKYERELHKALGQTVGEVMTAKVISIEPGKLLSEAAKLMHEKHIHRLPVVDEAKQVIGIVTRSDILRAMATQE